MTLGLLPNGISARYLVTGHTYLYTILLEVMMWERNLQQDMELFLYSGLYFRRINVSTMEDLYSAEKGTSFLITATKTPKKSYIGSM